MEVVVSRKRPSWKWGRRGLAILPRVQVEAPLTLQMGGRQPPSLWHRGRPLQYKTGIAALLLWRGECVT